MLANGSTTMDRRGAGCGLGLVPGSIVGARVAGRVPERAARLTFGTTLVVFAVAFLVRHHS